MEIVQFACHSNVKSNFGEFKRSKISFLALLEGLNFNFSKFEPFLKSQIYQNSKLRVSEIVIMAIFDIQILPKLSDKSMLVLWTLTSHFESFWSIVHKKNSVN